MKIRFLSALLAVLMLIGTFATIILPVSAAKKDEEPDIEDVIAEHLTTIYTTPQQKLSVMTKKLDKNGYELWVLPETGEIAFVDKASEQITFSNPWNVAVGTESEDTKKDVMSQVFINYNNNGKAATMNSFEEAAQRGQIVVKNIKNGLRVEYTIGREETRLLVPRYIKKSRFENQIAKPIFEGMLEDGIVDAEKLAEHLPSGDFRDVLYKKVKVPTSVIFYYNKFVTLYSLKDPNASDISPELQANIYKTWPATKTIGAIFVLAPDASTNELRAHEQTIKTYCPNYNYEELDKDHVECQYEGTDKAPPLFKLALEYTIDDWGLIVTLPASGIRFNESLYKLDTIEVLPYMGAGSNPNSGYTFFPDGSGTLFDFQELNTKQKVTVSGKIYGDDYAYHTIIGKNQEIIRYPAFGIVENYKHLGSVINGPIVPPTSGTDESGATTETTAPETTAPETTAPETSVGSDGTTSEKPAVKYEPDEDGTVTISSGLLCIIEEGDALATLTTYHGGATSKYNTVKMSFAPRPKDTYDLSGSLAVGTGNTWDVVSKRKYVGNYKIRYIMMTDQKIAQKNNIQDSYEPTWMGMASAYSDYLVASGALKKLTASDIKEEIPLFDETFGTTETLEKLLSVPVNVMTPLTSFEDVKTMYDELSEKGVGNINFKLTGYANGGIFASIPAALKWEKAVGGNEGFKDLVSYASEKDFGIFPDFDFVFVRASTDTLFDALNLKKHAVKTIDGRYTSRREYSATYQSYVSYYDLAVSPEHFIYFYNKLTANYSKYTTSGISVSTLGQNLNSNFDEDAPLNREDSKTYTVKLFDQLSKDYDNVMTDCGNYYSWSYVDYIVNVPLSSSRYIKSSKSVPFMGVVLHSFVQFAGTPTNMEGNISYAFLKAVESGAGLYFKLVYRNAEKLKEDVKLSQNYSVRYDIWKDDMIIMYNQLNELISDVQLSRIVAHKFLDGYRVPDSSEVEADKAAKEEQEKLDKLQAELEAAAKEMKDIYTGRTQSLTEAQKYSVSVTKICDYILKASSGYYDKLIEKIAHIALVEKAIEDAKALKDNIAKVQAEYDALVKANDAAAEAKKAELEALQVQYNGICKIEGLLDENGDSIYRDLDADGDSIEKLEKRYANLVIDVKSNINMMYNTYNGVFAQLGFIKNNVELAGKAAGYFVASKGFSAELEKEVSENEKLVKAEYENAISCVNNCYDKVKNALEIAEKYIYDETTAEEDRKVVITYQEYLESLAKEEEDKKDEVTDDEVVEEEVLDNRYYDNSGNIVLVKYENGKTFILNYNYFDVKVVVDGVEYTVEKCGFDTATRTYTGYLIINEGGAQ